MDKLHELVGLIARLKMSEEMGEEFDAENAAWTLDELIASARQVLAAERVGA